MTKPNLLKLLKETKGEGEAPTPPRVRAATGAPANAPEKAPGASTRQPHKVGEVNVSAYFPAEVKAALRMAQAKTGKNVKQCLAEALQDFFRKYNVPVPVDLGDGR